jgi:hypothetical protein
MTVAERYGYAWTIALGSLKGGGTVWQYGPGVNRQVPDDRTRWQRVRTAPRVFWLALKGINEENRRRGTVG